MNAVYRLIATSKVYSKETSEWWENLPADQKKEYVTEHPNSKYADQAIKEHEEKKAIGKHVDSHEDLTSEKRKSYSSSIKKSSAKIAGILQHTFPRITEAGSALRSLATGKKLHEEQKEVLHELGGIALKTALSHVIGDPNAGTALGKIGITAIKHAIDHFHQNRKNNPDKNNLELFVNGVADGIEHAEEVSVPREHAVPKSEYRSALAKHFKNATNHIVQVIDKSFEHVKPAVQGLNQLRKGEPLNELHKKSIKGLGKIALGIAIGTLPGGLAAHLAAGVGVTAINHAIKKMRNAKGDHLLHKFVEAISEGIEEGIIEHAAEGKHE